MLQSKKNILYRKSTFTKLTYWIDEIKANRTEDMVIIIVGNKVDLKSE